MSPALDAWLADAGRQAASHRRSDAALRMLRECAPLRRFRTRLAALCEADAPHIAEAIAALFETPDWLDGVIAAQIAEARADPFFVPPWRGIGSALHRAALLIEEPRAAIAIGVIEPDALAARKAATRGRGSVNFAGRRTVLKFLKAGGAQLSFWQAPPIDGRFSAAGAGRCERVGRRAIVEGELLTLDTGRSSYVVERARSAIVFLQGEVRLGGAVVAREYDAGSRRLIAASSGDECCSRIQLMLSWLRHAGRREAAPLFDELSRDGPFHLRWHAMREWVALDAEAALSRLRAMAMADEHGEVRAAAARTLDWLAAREGAGRQRCRA